MTLPMPTFAAHTATLALGEACRYAAVCHVRGLPHLVALLDRAAAEIRQQEGNES